ncbi:uncharacterized protein BCR38DRAFT_30518 [Pseudomassariella vexata]|uniref:Uncharacterized protein n=1 Tax=Pseudomassariella vexata TaxID=1141098 RepID=A0A1Y2DPR5_9PEZI|nr:uncharacterized protein BCR38DRAFT_30518 [Pseudomassariella vexata]ORY61250.1 hypothetical protein BCR38DRAFT_30518 [Pseudomassariella vexata]
METRDFEQSAAQMGERGASTRHHKRVWTLFFQKTPEPRQQRNANRTIKSGKNGRRRKKVGNIGPVPACRLTPRDRRRPSPSNTAPNSFNTNPGGVHQNESIARTITIHQEPSQAIGSSAPANWPSVENPPVVNILDPSAGNDNIMNRDGRWVKSRPDRHAEQSVIFTAVVERLQLRDMVQPCVPGEHADRLTPVGKRPMRSWINLRVQIWPQNWKEIIFLVLHDVDERDAEAEYVYLARDFFAASPSPSQQQQRGMSRAYSEMGPLQDEQGSLSNSSSQELYAQTFQSVAGAEVGQPLTQSPWHQSDWDMHSIPNPPNQLAGLGQGIHPVNAAPMLCGFSPSPMVNGNLPMTLNTFNQQMHNLISGSLPNPDYFMSPMSPAPPFVPVSSAPPLSDGTLSFSDQTINCDDWEPLPGNPYHWPSFGFQP